MGSTESKMAAPAPAKAQPVKHGRVGELMDPRSPSAAIDRTPIQVGGFGPKVVPEVKSEAPLAFTDPRSPSAGIARTPIREVMRATVGSFARRLGMIFHNETEGKAPRSLPPLTPDATEEPSKDDGELASAEPLLAPHPCLAEHANLLHTPVTPAVQSEADVSPFMLLERPQVEVELQTEADISLEEAEEAKESPFRNRLSMSLITCHEGATSSHVFAEVHCDGEPSPGPGEQAEAVGGGVDHCYALPSISVDAEEPPSPADVAPADDPSAPPAEAEQIPPPEEPKGLGEERPPAQVVSSPEQPKPSQHIRCPTFDPRSPSQVVFKPQWLGKGFGANGLRVKGGSGKGGSSPLAVRVAVKNATNENKGQSGKRKQKGAEGRSPLQILKENNSPRDHRHQMKAKTSTPDKPRLGQMDNRVLPVCLDKENR